MSKKLTFKEIQALKDSLIDRDLFKRVKDKLEEDGFSNNAGLNNAIWEPAYEAFLVEKT